MTASVIVRHRLINQQIATTKFTEPQEIVTWLAGMQAQEFAHAKWAIGLRLPALTDGGVEKAFNDGKILRTHLLRPTWHFVTPADIRWMLALTAPRVNAVNTYWYRKFELDIDIFKRSKDILIKTLQGGKQLTRPILQSALAQEKIVADGLRLGYLLMRAELDGIICSGARQGKQFTYALLDERVPTVNNTFDREEALATLTKRYFASRGPATLRDFVWWSGLTMKDVKAGVAMLPPHFIRDKTDGQEYIFIPADPAPTSKLQTTFLMPEYDEYGISYKDRSALFNPATVVKENQRGNTAYSHMLVINGKIAGTWKRTAKNNPVIVETAPFTFLHDAENQALIQAVKRYQTFTGNVCDE